MTFDEWWKSKKTLIETVVNNNKSHIDLIVFIKSIMNIAWDTSQPKWTLCKDGKNPEQNQRVNVIIKPEIKKNPLYVDTVVYRDGNYINERMCHFEDVIAWMPLPEVK